MLKFLQDKGASVELAELVVTLADAIEKIAEVIVVGDTGYAGTKNSFGEDQVTMDVKAEELMQQHLKGCSFVASFCSEELDEMQMVHVDGKFTAYYDPIDGSSLINVNFSVGTIIGIYEGDDVMGRTPREQVAAIFAVYGPRTSMVITVGDGVHEFFFRNGAWELVEESLVLKNDKKYFAPGNLRATKERDDYFDLVTGFMKDGYTLRYSGGMVPDINHILHKGSGIFMYPGMPSASNGKLRLLYECGPMAFIMEQAGGTASNGEVDILDVEIKELVQRTPIFLGSPEDVKKAVDALQSH